jgi:hypothetical protein
MPDEIRLDFSDATLRSNNLGGQGPGPELCASEPENKRCGFYDLNTTHPYYEKMGASLHSSMPAALADACRIPSGASLRQFSAMSRMERPRRDSAVWWTSSSPP